jgi:hypothetical protein
VKSGVKNIGQPLFVHECRCMAAPAEGLEVRKAEGSSRQTAPARLHERRATGNDGGISARLAAISLARDGFGAHLLDVGRIRMMESETFR